MPPTDAEDSSPPAVHSPLMIMAARTLKNIARRLKRVMNLGARSPSPQWELMILLIFSCHVASAGKTGEISHQELAQVCQPFNCDQEELSGGSEDADPEN
jgi:hypothetical protein